MVALQPRNIQALSRLFEADVIPQPLQQQLEPPPTPGTSVWHVFELTSNRGCSVMENKPTVTNSQHEPSRRYVSAFPSAQVGSRQRQPIMATRRQEEKKTPADTEGLALTFCACNSRCFHIRHPWGGALDHISNQELLGVCRLISKSKKYMCSVSTTGSFFRGNISHHMNTLDSFLLFRQPK